MILVFVLVLALCIFTTSALAALLWHRSTHGLLHERLRKRVVVTLKSGDSFAGVLYDSDAQSVVLHQAEALGIGENRTNVVVDGEVLVLRSDVAFIQLP